jgi:hypothetical protein
MGNTINYCNLVIDELISRGAEDVNAVYIVREWDQQGFIEKAFYENKDVEDVVDDLINDI